MEKNRQQPKKTKRSRTQVIAGVIAGVMALLMLGSVLVGALTAGAISKSDVDKLKAQVNAAATKKKELKNQLSGIASDKSAIAKQITLLDEQIEAQEDELSLQEQLLAQLEQDIVDKTAELEKSEAEEQAQYDKMKNRVRYMAEHDNTSYLSILLSADNFSDFLNRYEIVRQISTRDKAVFTQLKAIRDQVASEKAALEQSRAEAEATRAEMQENKKQLEAQRTKKEQQQANLANSEDATKKAYAAMIEKEEALMEDYKKAAAQLSAQSTYVGGNFMWPLPASNNVITCKWGYRVHPVTGVYKLHTGIDLRASVGTKVYAANGGTVTTSSYSSAWGNYIIISHGGGLTTLYAHLSRRSVSKGDSVKQGDIIGYSGNTGYSTGAHLHFEIDKNGVSYNPMTEFKNFSVVYK